MIKNLFPILKNNDITYLDNAATTQKSQCTIDAIKNFYENYNFPIHRGVYKGCYDALTKYDSAIENIKNFFNAQNYYALLIRSTTEGLNAAAQMLPGKNILISNHEHHSNILPWVKRIKQNTTHTLTTAPIHEIHDHITSQTNIISICHACNVTGRMNDIQQITNAAHENCIVVVDGAQAVAHVKINLDEMNPHMYVFSGHKIYGPTGIGIAFIRKDLGDSLSKYSIHNVGGGSVINADIHDYSISDQELKFSHGTPPAAELIGLSQAINMLKKHDQYIDKQQIMHYLYDEMSKLNVKIISKKGKIPMLAFYSSKMHPHDICTIMDQHNIYIRGGGLCAYETIKNYGIQYATRVSLGIYNDMQDVEKFLNIIKPHV